MKFMRKILSFFGLGSLTRSARTEFIGQTAIRVAVARTIEKAPNIPVAANRIAHVAERIRHEVDAGIFTRVDQLKPRLMTYANVLAMDESNKILAETLITMIATEFTERAGNGLIKPTDEVNLKKLCDLVIDSTKPFRE